MSTVTYPPDSTLARFTAAFRARGDDPRGYTTPRNKRLDMKYALNPHFNELISIIEQRGMMDVVRLCNTTGSAWTAPVLLKLATSKLTARTTATATNSPSGASSVVYLVSATFVVGQVVAVTSGGYTDYGIVTAVSGGVSVTVSNIWYDHTTPTITALPAYEASLADADDTDGALWVTTADIANGSYGWGFGAVESANMDSSSYTAEALLYLSGTAGAFTATAPTGIDQQQQVVGVVKTSHASTGRIHWFPGARWFQKIGGNMLQNGINPEQQDWKNSVRVATTVAGTLATSFENGDTVDGVVLATGDRILIKNQAAGAENGIYTVNASGAPTRATDADASAEVTSGLSVHVSEGTTNADTNWILTTNDPITLDTTALTFTQLSGSGGAPSDAQYVTLATNGTLTNERVATAGSMISLADAGAGSTLTWALDINGGSAKANALDPSADMVPIYDSVASANKKAALAPMLGRRNVLINGDFAVCQRDGRAGVTTFQLGVSSNATTSAGSAVVTGISDTATIRVGDIATSSNIPAGRTVASIDSATQITLNSGASVTAGTTSTIFGRPDNGYVADRWRVLSETSGSVIYQTFAVGPANSWQYATFQGHTANLKFGTFQVIEGKNCKHLRSKAVALSFQLKVSDARLGNMKCAIIEFTGTEDSVSGDPISAWNGAGTAPTLAANYAYISEGGTPVNLSATTSFAQYKVTATCGASLTNLAVLIWNDDATYTAADYFAIADVQLEAGAFPTPYDRQPYGQSLAECQRYFILMPNSAVFMGCRAQTAVIVFYYKTQVPMRTSPTLVNGGLSAYINSAPGSWQITAYNYVASAYFTITGALTVSGAFLVGDSVRISLTAGTSFSGTAGDFAEVNTGSGNHLGLSAEL